MLEGKTFLGNTNIKSLLDERRTEDRYHCKLRSLCKRDSDDESLKIEETWAVARVLDISQHGVALVLPFRAATADVLTLIPIIPSWRTEWQLTVRVKNLRRHPSQGWCAGCEFEQPLSKGQLEVLLRNSEQERP